MEQVKCPRCGQPVVAGSKFCINCGANLANQNTADNVLESQGSVSDETRINVPHVAPVTVTKVVETKQSGARYFKILVGVVVVLFLGLGYSLFCNIRQGNKIDELTTTVDGLKPTGEEAFVRRAKILLSEFNKDVYEVMGEYQDDAGSVTYEMQQEAQEAQENFVKENGQKYIDRIDKLIEDAKKDYPYLLYTAEVGQLKQLSESLKQMLGNTISVDEPVEEAVEYLAADSDTIVPIAEAADIASDAEYR